MGDEENYLSRLCNFESTCAILLVHIRFEDMISTFQFAKILYTIFDRTIDKISIHLYEFSLFCIDYRVLIIVCHLIVSLQQRQTRTEEIVF